MRKYSRSEFLSLSAILAGAAALTKVPFGRASAQQPITTPSMTDAPDLVVVNGRVLTMDAKLPRAQAFAVKHGRFVAVGSTSDIRNIVKRGTPVVDAGGAIVLPGFIDCHCHPRGVNELYEVDAN